MAFIYDEPSHTFSEYLLLPGYTSAEHIPNKVSLKAPLCRFKKGDTPRLSVNIPLTSAVMQAVSNDTLAIALAQEGGISFIFGSQPIEKQADMVRRVKKHKAGFVTSDSNLRPEDTLAHVLSLRQKTGHRRRSGRYPGRIDSLGPGRLTQGSHQPGGWPPIY